MIYVIYQKNQIGSFIEVFILKIVLMLLCISRMYILMIARHWTNEHNKKDKLNLCFNYKFIKQK